MNIEYLGLVWRSLALLHSMRSPSVDWYLGSGGRGVEVKRDVAGRFSATGGS